MAQIKKTQILSILLIAIIVGVVGGVSAVGTYPAVDPNMVLYYHFNNDSSVMENYSNTANSVVYDYSGSFNNGTAYNITWNSTGGFLGDGALEFDGNLSLVNTTNRNLFNTTEDITLSLWFKSFSKSTSAGYIFSHPATTGTNRMYVIRQTNGNLDTNSGATTATLKTSATYNESIWHHLVVVRYPMLNRTIYYFDGFLLLNQSTPMTVNASVSGDESNLGQIGSRVTFYNGSIDEVSIYNKSISPTEVYNLYQSYIGNFSFSSPTPYDFTYQQTNLTTINITGYSSIKDSVWININNTNYTMTCSSSTNFQCNLTNLQLPDGTFYYTPYFNDTNGNIHSGVARVISIDTSVITGCSRLNDTFTNLNGNFTLNVSRGTIISIKDLLSNTEMLRNGFDTGVLISSNNFTQSVSLSHSSTWLGLNAGQNIPSQTTGTVLINNKNRFKWVVNLTDLVGTSFNITYDYVCSNDKFDINTNLEKTKDSEDKYIDFKYSFRLATNYWNWSITPHGDGLTRIVNKTNVTSNGFIIRRANTLFNGDAVTLFNNTFRFTTLIRDVPPQGFSDMWRSVPASTIPLEYSHNYIYFNDSNKKSFGVNITLAFGNDIMKIKNNTYNDVNITINESLYGNFWHWHDFSQNLDNDPDGNLTWAKSHNVKVVLIDNWYGLLGRGTYPSSGTWNLSATTKVNSSFLNEQINLLVVNNMSVFLYISAIEAWNETVIGKFDSDIMANGSGEIMVITSGAGGSNGGRYDIGMELSNNTAWFKNITTQVNEVLATYQNVSGIFLDRLDIENANYNCSTPLHWNNNFNKTYCNSYEGHIEFIKNISKSLKSQGKMLIVNHPESAYEVKYADAIAGDPQSSLNSGLYPSACRVNSLNKPCYMIEYASSLSNVSSFLEKSKFWGMYHDNGDEPSYEITKYDDFFVVNLTSTSLLTDYFGYLNGENYLTYKNRYTGKSFYAINPYDNNATFLTNDSSLLNNFSIREGNIFIYSPIWFSSSSSTSKSIASNLSDAVNVDTYFNVDSCETVGLITYTPHGGATQTYNRGDYSCSNNQATLGVITINPASGSGVITIAYGCSATATAGFRLVMILASFTVISFLVYRIRTEGSFGVAEIVVTATLVIISVVMWQASGQNLGGAGCGAVG